MTNTNIPQINVTMGGNYNSSVTPIQNSMSQTIYKKNSIKENNLPLTNQVSNLPLINKMQIQNKYI